MGEVQTDIVISGGGIAGLTAAVAFGSAGFSVICVEPSPPVTKEGAKDSDLRSTAFLQPSVEFLKEIGLWARLAPYAAPLQIMRIVDAGGKEPTPRLVKDFNAKDISDAPFGWNLPNWLLKREISQHLADLPNVRLEMGVATTKLFTRTNEARVTLSNDEKITTRLLIAADGRNSAMREALDIPVRTTRYGQKALAFAVSHSLPHDNVSTEVHRSGGPFTMVPLPDRDGRPASAVVWMETGANAQRLAEMSEADFTREMNIRSCGILGEMQLISGRGLFPIIAQVAQKMYGQRTALMAEAAHVVPPIGAQGLNMSLADMKSLWTLARQTPSALGNETMLEAYHRARHGDIEMRLHGIDLLNRASMMEPLYLRNIRAGLLDMIYSLAPIRQEMMRAGLGLR